MASTTSSSIGEEQALLFRSLFPIFEAKNYLNSCSLGPLSIASREAQVEYADDWAQFGAPAWWLRWMPKIDRIRELFAELISCDMSALTIHHSASSALSSIASAIDYTTRNKIVVADIDFPTIAYQWLAKRDVEVVFAHSADGVTIPIEEYERLIDDRTAAVATSHIFYATGAIQDVGSIAEIAHGHGALAIIDGYHAGGVVPVNVRTLDVDFYIGGTLKWVCGGPGLTFIYASPEAQMLLPQAPGWFASQDQFAFDTTNFQPAESALRFQMGTPAVPTVYTGIPALELLLEIGVERIYERVQMLTTRISEHADRNGLTTASPRKADERGGVVMLKLDDPASIVAALDSRGIIVDARPGKLRISPHYFNSLADVDAVMTGILEILQTSVA